jgi:ATP-dependent RNA helicase RhlE
MPFLALGLSPSLSRPLARLGYTTPTPVQLKSIPIVLSGRDLVVRAPTGTGKTAAFGLPMIDRLLVRGGSPNGARKPVGLVLVPTRELAQQVHKSLDTYGVPANVRVTAIFGGVSIVPQKNELRRGTDIIVATPGRLLDHLQQRTVDLSGVKILTLDEADRMLDMGFLPPLRRILTVLPRERQTLLFSATLSPDVIRLAENFTREAERIDVSGAELMAPTVMHHVHPVSHERKGDLLTHILRQTPTGQALVFCRTKHGSNRVGQYLERAGMKTAVIHGNKSQGARTRALGDFKAGRVTVLVATDIAARGLDIVQLPLVVNFDLPMVAEDYIHRAGRTGRAGLAGRAVSLVSPADRSLLRDIQRLLPSPVEHVVLEGFPVTASSQESLPDSRRRRHDEPHTRSSRGQRPAARHGSGGSGMRRQNRSAPGAQRSQRIDSRRSNSRRDGREQAD